MKTKCSACGEEKELYCFNGKDGRFYVDIQGKVILRIKSTESLYVICIRCAKYLGMIE